MIQRKETYQTALKEIYKYMLYVLYFSKGYFIQPTIIEASDPTDKILQEVCDLYYHIYSNKHSYWWMLTTIIFLSEKLRKQTIQFVTVCFFMPINLKIL